MSGRLQIAQLVTIEAAQGGSPHRLSFVVAESSASEVVLRLSGDDELLRLIVPGQAVELSMSDSTGIHRAKAVVKRTTLSPNPGLILSPPHVFQTTQNRNFFRVYTKLEAPYHILSSVEETAVGQEDRGAFTQDISAGGLRLWTLRQLFVGDRIRVRVVCPCDDELAPLKARSGPAPADKRTVSLDAEVLRAERLPTTRKTCYTVGVRFIDLSVSEQDRLVGLMFDLQRRQRNS